MEGGGSGMPPVPATQIFPQPLLIRRSNSMPSYASDAVESLLMLGETPVIANNTNQQHQLPQMNIQPAPLRRSATNPEGVRKDGGMVNYYQKMRMRNNEASKRCRFKRRIKQESLEKTRMILDGQRQVMGQRLSRLNRIKQLLTEAVRDINSKTGSPCNCMEYSKSIFETRYMPEKDPEASNQLIVRRSRLLRNTNLEEVLTAEINPEDIKPMRRGPRKHDFDSVLVIDTETGKLKAERGDRMEEGEGDHPSVEEALYRPGPHSAPIDIAKSADTSMSSSMSSSGSESGREALDLSSTSQTHKLEPPATQIERKLPLLAPNTHIVPFNFKTSQVPMSGAVSSNTIILTPLPTSASSPSPFPQTVFTIPLHQNQRTYNSPLSANDSLPPSPPQLTIVEKLEPDDIKTEPGTEEIEHDGVPPTTLNHPSIITTNPNLNYVDRFSPNLKNAASLWINPITSSVITAKAKIESVAGPKCEPVAGKPLAKLDPHLDANSYKKPSGSATFTITPAYQRNHIRVSPVLHQSVDSDVKPEVATMMEETAAGMVQSTDQEPGIAVSEEADSMMETEVKEEIVDKDSIAEEAGNLLNHADQTNQLERVESRLERIVEHMDEDISSASSFKCVAANHSSNQSCTGELFDLNGLTQTLDLLTMKPKPPGGLTASEKYIILSRLSLIYWRAKEKQAWICQNHRTELVEGVDTSCCSLCGRKRWKKGSGQMYVITYRMGIEYHLTHGKFLGIGLLACQYCKSRTLKNLDFSGSVSVDSTESEEEKKVSLPYILPSSSWKSKGNLAAIQPVQQKLSKPVAIAPSPAQPVQNRGTIFSNIEKLNDSLHALNPRYKPLGFSITNLESLSPGVLQDTLDATSTALWTVLSSMAPGQEEQLWSAVKPKMDSACKPENI